MPVSKVYKNNNTEPRQKTKEVFKKVIKDNKPMKTAVTEVYGSTYNGTLLKKTKGWQQLLKANIKDDKLLRVLNEGLDANKGEEPDHAIRHKFMDTGFKLKGRYPKEGNTTAVQVNINNDREEFK